MSDSVGPPEPNPYPGPLRRGSGIGERPKNQAAVASAGSRRARSKKPLN